MGLTVIFWILVIVIGIFAFLQVHLDSLFESLHHVSVGIMIIIASILAIYYEAWRKRENNSFRTYFFEHQVMAICYLLMSGFIVDPFPHDGNDVMQEERHYPGLNT